MFNSIFYKLMTFSDTKQSNVFLEAIRYFINVILIICCILLSIAGILLVAAIVFVLVFAPLFFLFEVPGHVRSLYWLFLFPVYYYILFVFGVYLQRWGFFKFINEMMGD